MKHKLFPLLGEEPFGDLVLMGVLHDGHDLVDLLLAELAGALAREQKTIEADPGKATYCPSPADLLKVGFAICKTRTGSCSGSKRRLRPTQDDPRSTIGRAQKVAL